MSSYVSVTIAVTGYDAGGYVYSVQGQCAALLLCSAVTERSVLSFKKE